MIKEYTIVRHDNGSCYIRDEKGIRWTHFKVGDVIKHRLKLDNNKLIDLTVKRIHGHGVETNEGYSIPFRRAFEENYYGVSDDDILDILQTLFDEDSESVGDDEEKS